VTNHIRFETHGAASASEGCHCQWLATCNPCCRSRSLGSLRRRSFLWLIAYTQFCSYIGNFSDGWWLAKSSLPALRSGGGGMSRVRHVTFTCNAPRTSSPGRWLIHFRIMTINTFFRMPVSPNKTDLQQFSRTAGKEHSPHYQWRGKTMLVLRRMIP
jgi:hypothetical protein